MSNSDGELTALGITIIPRPQPNPITSGNNFTCEIPENGSALTGRASNVWRNLTHCLPWTANQWEASFKQIPFFVESDSRSGGRRIHVHEYPSRQQWDNEDLGRLRQQVDVQGYVVGDQSDLWAEELFAACTSSGAGELYLPMRTPLAAHCLTVESVFQAERMGRIDFSMQFSLVTWAELQKIKRPVRVSHTMLMTNILQTADKVKKAARLQFELSFTGAQPSVSRRAASIIIGDVTRMLARAGTNSRLNSLANSALNFITKYMEDNKADLSYAQRSVSNVLTSTAGINSQEVARFSYLMLALGELGFAAGKPTAAKGKPNEGFGGLFEKAMQLMQEGTTSSPGDVAAALFGLSMLRPTALRASLSTAKVKSTEAELQIAETICAYVRRMALAQSIISGIKVAPARQPDASIKRKTLLEQLDTEMNLASQNVDLHLAFRKLRAAVIDFISFYSAKGAATVPIPVSSTFRPVIAMASDMYVFTDSTTRDEEIMWLNGIEHPMFPSRRKNKELYALYDHSMDMI